MTSNKTDRRQVNLSPLDIDPRKNPSRRDEGRRDWLGFAYRTIYIPAYVNTVHPEVPTTIHAFSNDEAEIPTVEWVVSELGVEDAKSGAALRTIAAFSREMIQRDLVVNAAGNSVPVSDLEGEIDVEHLYLKIAN